MNRLYFFILVIGVVCSAYFMGQRVASEQCRANVASEFITHQADVIKLQEGINAEVLGRNTDDIRCVLREKYTIAE